jgi:hypothetical protein
MTRRAGQLLGAVVVVLAVAAGALVLVLDRSGSEDCPVATTELPADRAQLVDVADLLPAGSVGVDRRPVVAAVDGLGGPFGRVLAGRFYDRADEVPSLVPAGPSVGLATVGSVQIVDMPEGDPRWGRAYDGVAAGGGVVDDAFVVLVGGAAPAVVALDLRDGAPRGCVAVPVSGGDVDGLLTDQAGGDVVVAAAPPAASATLSRIDPVAGSVRWQGRLAGVSEVGSVTVAGASVVVGRIGSDPVRLAEMASAGGIGSPMLTAYSLDDGEPTWSYPRTDEAATVAASVIGRDDANGVTLVLTAAASGPGAPAMTVVALDDDGAELWRQRLGRGLWSGGLWGSLLVMQGPDARSGAVLRAFATTDGAPAWTLRSREFPARGDRPRRSFGAGVAVGDSFVVPAPNGLLVVDPVSGRAEPLDSEEPIDQLLAVEDIVVVRVREALLVVSLE